MSKCIQGIQDIKRNTKYQAATSPAQDYGHAFPWPAHARPWAWAGPAAAGYFVFILYISDLLDISWIYLDIQRTILGYLFRVFFVYVLVYFGYMGSWGVAS